MSFNEEDMNDFKDEVKKEANEFKNEMREDGGIGKTSEECAGKIAKYVILAIITFIFRGVPVFGFPIIGLACLGCIIAVVMNIIEYRKLIKIEEANGELTRQKRNQNKR